MDNIVCFVGSELKALGNHCMGFIVCICKVFGTALPLVLHCVINGVEAEYVSLSKLEL